MSHADPTPAARLEGRTVGTGWQVLRRIDLSNTTGGHFSEAYHVRHADGREAFLKALDYAAAFDPLEPDTLGALQKLVNMYAFERDLIARCVDRRMDRVVRALEYGTAIVEGAVPPKVEFIVFELADGGDVRGTLDTPGAATDAWTLRSLHHVATGMMQLHRAGIAHQDIKPSNVLVFRNERCSKVTDLGRASAKDRSGPSDDFDIAGDWGYAPPELLYGYRDSDWTVKRIGCDVYLFGSLVHFYFTKTNMTAAILSRLQPAQHWRNWTATFADALPFLQMAFSSAMNDFRPASLDEKSRAEIVQVVRELCAPDPKLRGRPGARVVEVGGLALERYVAIFDRLARVAEKRG